MTQCQEDLETSWEGLMEKEVVWSMPALLVILLGIDPFLHTDLAS